MLQWYWMSYLAIIIPGNTRHQSEGFATEPYGLFAGIDTQLRASIAQTAESQVLVIHWTMNILPSEA